MAITSIRSFRVALPQVPADAPAESRRLALALEGVCGLFVLAALVVMLSSSSVISTALYGSGLALFERQLIWTVLGAISFAVASRIDLSWLRRHSLLLLLAALGSLLVVLAAGHSAGGSSRWIGVGFVRLQPTEFAKLIFTIFAADFLAYRARARYELEEVVIPLGCAFAMTALLVVAQPDLGSTIMLSLIFFALLFGAGIERRLFVRTVCVIAAAGTMFALSASYRRQRLLSFLSPFAHESTTGYNLVQSLLALGSGHLTGTGFGTSAATWGFLPNAQTDFIFAVIGNQYGYIGGLCVMAGFTTIGVLGIRIALRARDRFSSLLALGLTTWIVGQAIINIGGVMSVMPETGIPLPFLSFGGSSLIAVLFAVGLLVNVAHHARSSTVANEAGQRFLSQLGARLPVASRLARR